MNEFSDPQAALIALADSLTIVAPEPTSPAAGRVLSAAVLADRDSPAADVSAMDGYAVRLIDLQSPHTTVCGEAQAGTAPATLPLGSAIRIFTGAVVPQGAEAVVMREDADESSALRVVWRERAKAVRRGQNIRFRGENAKAGESVVPAGSLLTPASIAALANFGSSTVALHRLVNVTILVTGNELLDADSQPEPWQLRDSNGPTIAAVCGQHPWIRCLRSVRCPDDPQTLRQSLANALRESDAVILTGGVSKGDYDHVPEIIAQAGARTVFHRLPIRPGRPILGAVSKSGQLILGLPGNPVSAIVGMTYFGIPLLAKQSGQFDWQPNTHWVFTTGAVEETLPLHWFRLARLSGPAEAELVHSKGSGDLVALSRSTGFVYQAPGSSGPGPWAYHPWR